MKRVPQFTRRSASLLPQRACGALTEPEWIARWQSGGGIQVITTWQPGSSISFAGTWHGVRYADKGTVLEFEPGRRLRYTYWSRFSRLPDAPEHYSTIEFTLSEAEDTTLLSVSHTNLATRELYGHANFHWTMALDRLRRLLETLAANPSQRRSSMVHELLPSSARK